MSELPENLKYTEDHEWIAENGEFATVGITAHAAEELGDIVYVDLPAIGDLVSAGDACGEIESTKAVSELVAPATGEVVEVNEALDLAPETVGDDPYGGGWLYKIRVLDTGDLLDAVGYQALLDA